MHTKNSNDNITFEFTTSDNDIEQENYILKETLNQMKEELKKAKQELEDLEKEWDRLDSMALLKRQGGILANMEKVQKEIDGMEYTIRLMNW